MRLRSTTWFTIVGLAAAVAGCGTAAGGAGGSTIFEGVVVGSETNALLSGKLSLTIATTSLRVADPALMLDLTGVAASANVTGTLTPEGGTAVALTGTYDTEAHTLSISGGGYSFTGTFSGGLLSGTFTTAGGGGGSFSTSSKSGGTVYSFCGTAAGNQGSQGATFNVVFNATSNAISGFAMGNGDHEQTVLTGTISGSNWSLTFTEHEHGYPGSATGTFTSTTMTGTYSIPGNGETGTVSGAICQ